MKPMKPMLAATALSLADIELPAVASPKLDGIRAMVIDGKLVSRNLKPIPNTFIRSLFEYQELNGLDGELIMGDPTDKNVFRNTASAVMSRAGKPQISFLVFDCFKNPTNRFLTRLSESVRIVDQFDDQRLVSVPHTVISSEEELAEFENQCVDDGYEGIMTRAPGHAYKFGRSTLRNQGLVKVKRFLDAKARIVGFEEQMQNTNDATVDILGRTKRSNHKSGMIGKRTLGALVVEGLERPFLKTSFNVGSGMDDELRSIIWHDQERYLNRIITFKYFPIGCKDAPRFSVFLRFELPL